MTIRIEYDTTLEERADAGARGVLRLKATARTRWQSVIVSGLLSGLILYFIVSFEEESFLWRFVPSIAVAAVVGVVVWIRFPQDMKTRIHKIYRAEAESNDPTPVVMELRDDCVWTESKGHTQVIQRDNLSEVVDVGDAIELRLRDGGCVFVPKRAFPDDETRSMFLQTASGLLKTSKSLPAVL